MLSYIDRLGIGDCLSRVLGKWATLTRTRKTENRSRDPWVTGIWIYDLIYGSMIDKNGAHGGFPYYAHNTIDHCFTLWAVNPTIYTHSIDTHLFCPILVQKHNVKWTFSWTLSKYRVMYIPITFTPDFQCNSIIYSR